MSDTNGSAAAPPAPSSASTAPAATSGGAAAASSYELTSSMQRAGVRDEISATVAAWLDSARGSNGELPTVAAEHGYKFDTHGFLPIDRAALDHFGNALKAKGATQIDVDAVLSWYKGLPAVARADVEARQYVEAMDLQHRDEVERTLSGEWGTEYATNVQLISRYLDGLPASERDAIESRLLPDGRRALNDAATLRDLVQRARAGSETREQIEALMGNRASRYWKGPDAVRLQALYRDLISGRRA